MGTDKGDAADIVSGPLQTNRAPDFSGNNIVARSPAKERP
jgi:hypothetical protein